MAIDRCRPHRRANSWTHVGYVCLSVSLFVTLMDCVYTSNGSSYNSVRILANISYVDRLLQQNSNILNSRSPYLRGRLKVTAVFTFRYNSTSARKRYYYRSNTSVVLVMSMGEGYQNLYAQNVSECFAASRNYIKSRRRCFAKS